MFNKIKDSIIGVCYSIITLCKGTSPPILSEKERKILNYIGFIILDSENGSYSETYRLLDLMRITNLKYKKRIIFVTLERPGILIGRRGELINLIKKELSVILKEEIGFHIIESKINNSLYPLPLEDYEMSLD